MALASPAVADCLYAGGVRRELVETIWSSVDPARLVSQRAREDGLAVDRAGLAAV